MTHAPHSARGLAGPLLWTEEALQSRDPQRALRALTFTLFILTAIKNNSVRYGFLEGKTEVLRGSNIPHR